MNKLQLADLRVNNKVQLSQNQFMIFAEKDSISILYLLRGTEERNNINAKWVIVQQEDLQFNRKITSTQLVMKIMCILLSIISICLFCMIIGFCIDYKIVQTVRIGFILLSGGVIVSTCFIHRWYRNMYVTMPSKYLSEYLKIISEI